MTAAEFTAIVAGIHVVATRWLSLVTERAWMAFAEAPPTWVIGVTYGDDDAFRFCIPYEGIFTSNKQPVCWITWETSRSGDDLRRVFGDAVLVLMRELGMEWPK
jgi:hypothetical protein